MLSGLADDTDKNPKMGMLGLNELRDYANFPMDDYL
jgi:hypothetical protein